MLLAILACAASFASGWAAEPLRVRVLTYNIHHGEGTDGKIDLARTGEAIKRLTPDLVALQEVDKATTRSCGVDQAAELGKLTGMHAAFGKAMDFAGGQYGEAILSRHPLTEVQVHDLPFTEGCEPRCALAARVRLGEAGPEIVFASTHLEHAKASLRLCQAQKLNPVLAAKNTLPTILAGDFNDVPDSPAINVLQPHWTDATAGRPQPTWPSDQPRRKIDYVFFRPADGWRVVEQHVIDEPVASDHRPLLAVLECVPRGNVTKDVWRSQVFPETVRDYWVYVPKQYNGTKPARVMVFQDGHVYPSLIRSAPAKPIRVFLQDGDKDLDNAWGNWWLANLEMDAALKFKQYDYKFVGGAGGHSGKHGGAILPDSLRWLWRAPEPKAAPK